jgi:hypothetical protein
LRKHCGIELDTGATRANSCIAARGTAHQQRMPLFAAQQPIGLALFCQ